MSLKAKLEAIIYATEEPVTLNELASLLKDAVLADLRTEAVNEADHASEPAQDKEQLKAVKARLTSLLDELIADYASADRGMEIRQIAGGYRMATKPEHHDVVISLAKSLKPPVRLSLQALETLAVIAYKQPVTVPEISEIRGVDSAGVIATLLDRKLITTAGRKQVIGRPILYKTTKEFLLRFGLKDVSELPSVEEFEKLGEPQAELFDAPAAQAAAASAEAEPVTEAVPDPGHHLAGDSIVPAEGAFATEAEPEAEEKL
jgi:segregation and condensation protein B